MFSAFMKNLRQLVLRLDADHLCEGRSISILPDPEPLETGL